MTFVSSVSPAPSVSLHPTPAWRTVAREQLAAVRVALRNEMVLFLSVLGFFGALGIGAAIRAANQPHQHVAFAYQTGAAIPIMFVGLLLPFAVWRNEDPARRAYHWAMPVARGPHTLTKALAGWLWLLAAAAVYLLFLAGLSALMAWLGNDQPRTRSAAAWEWLVPVTAATVAYLYGSTAVLGSERPWRWIGGILIGYLLGLLVFDALGEREAKRILRLVVDGYYGLEAALFGEIDAGRRQPNSAARWLSATALWGALGAAGVWLAAYRWRAGG